AAARSACGGEPEPAGRSLRARPPVRRGRRVSRSCRAQPNLTDAGFLRRTEPDLLASLDLVALATVADVVPLTGLNRAFVRQGLSIMRSRRRIGLAALIDAAGLAGAPECWHLGYL